MKDLEETETIKYLFDHIKSVWTLSAGGLAFGVGILGFISKETLAPASIYHVVQLVIVISLVLYITSVLTGLTSHRKLMEAVLKSELNIGQTDQSAAKTDQQAKGKSSEKSVNEALVQLSRSRSTFITAGILLLITTLFFIGWSTLLPNNKPADITVTLKNVTVLTPDSRRIEVQDTSFKALDVSSSSQGEKHLEIRDLTLRGQLAGSSP